MRSAIFLFFVFFARSAKLEWLGSPVELHLYNVVSVEHHFRVLGFFRKLHPSAWHIGNDFAILDYRELILTLIGLQLILSRLELLASNFPGAVKRK